MTNGESICSDKCVASCPLFTDVGPDGTRVLRPGLTRERIETILDIARRAGHLTNSSCEEPKPMRPLYIGGQPGIRCDHHHEVITATQGLVLAVEEAARGINDLVPMPAPQPEV